MEVKTVKTRNTVFYTNIHIGILCEDRCIFSLSCLNSNIILWSRAEFPPFNHCSLMKGSEISNYIVDCSRRCGLFYEDIDARNIATPIILKVLYGFEYFCFRYYPAPRDKNGKIRGFPDKEIWKFNSDTYEFDRIENKDFRENRKLDYESLNKILSKKTIPQNQKIIKLLSHFRRE